MSKAAQQKRALMKPCLCARPRQKAVNYHFAVRRATGRKKFNKCARPNTCPSRAATFNMGRIDAKARACFQLWLGDSAPRARPLGISISVGKELVRRSAACVDGFRICKCPRRRWAWDQHAYCARVTRVRESVLPISLCAQPFRCHSRTDNHAICINPLLQIKKLLRSISKAGFRLRFSQRLPLIFASYFSCNIQNDPYATE